MTEQLYSIYDRVAMDFGPIFQARNDGVAVRAYRNYLKGREDAQGEYLLMHIGEYETSRGWIKGVEHPRAVDVPELDGVAPGFSPVPRDLPGERG